MKNIPSSDAELLRLAKKRVWLKRTLLWHFLAYALVNMLLLAIYYLTTPGGYFWPVWSMAGWGLGLIAHAVTVYSLLMAHKSQDSVSREYDRLKRESADE